MIITDPSFSIVVRITKGLGIQLSELFQADDVFKEVNSFDRSIMEKIALIEQLDLKEQQALFTMLDALIAKKKLTDTLSSALSSV